MKKVHINSNKWNIFKILYIIAALLFIFPSCKFLIKNKSMLNVDSNFHYLLNNTDKIQQAIAYLGIIILIIILYFMILKFRKKLFKDIKSVLIFVAIISLIFMFCVPIFSSDVFYYMGIGRINSEYNQNPYYVSMYEFVTNNTTVDLTNDTTLYMGYTNGWSNTTVVYGPIWTMICAFIAKISLGKAELCLLIFKVVNVIIHILNCYYIYKLSKKKLFALIYGLNPFIIIEFIVNVHNDIFMILFIILALYQMLKKKNIWLAIIFLAIATCIKYYSVLFLPFIILYYYRKEKTSVRIIKCIEFGLLFFSIVTIPYLFYIRDINVFSGMWIQQRKYSKSIGVILFKYFRGKQEIIGKLLYIFISAFAAKYILLLSNNNIKLKREINHLFYFVFIFLFVLITNFQPWYVAWIFPLIIWLKPRYIRFLIQITIIMLFDYIIFMVYEDIWPIGANFAIVYFSCFAFFILIDNIKRIKRYIRKRKKEKNENISHRRFSWREWSRKIKERIT